MTNTDYLNDIKEIKTMMRRSSRFISLSGLSGILAGVYALIGAWLAHQKLVAYRDSYTNIVSQNDTIQNSELVIDLVIIAAVVIVAAIATGIILTQRKAKKNGEHIFDNSALNLLINFSIPLIIGGIFSLILLQQGFISLIAATMLIFYGLACMNAGKYTLGHVKYLGYAVIILGLAATQYPGYGLYFWAVGFGIFHVIYGGLMYWILERNKQ